nr:NADH dehydrogenase subunit 2 [Onukigallia sp.]
MNLNLNFNSMLFLYSMSVGILLSLSSNNWLMIWIGLEISMMSIMPLMAIKSPFSSESCLSYFIVQSISSSLMMLGMLLMIGNSNFDFLLIMSLSIMIKVGAAPFHIWMLQIVETMNWMMMFLILSVIKIAPMNMLSYISIKLNMLSMVCLMVGSILGLAQNSIRKILVYSSIFNLGFLISSISMNSVWMTYFLIYTMSLIFIMMPLNKMNITYINQIILNEKTNLSKINIFVIMISMGGMPPMLGFLGKLMVIELLMSMKEFMVMLFMILSSMVVMFFYMRLSFLSSLFSSIMISTQVFKTLKISFWMLLMNLLFMPVIFTLKCLN